MGPLVSVVITNFNGKRFLDPCLASLFRQSFRNFEIILVDNGSTDGSAGFVREKFPDVIVIETGKNLGFAAGTNTGIRSSRGTFVLTLNNDTITDHFFIENLVKPMQSDPSLGMCASKMLFPDGKINSTGICISRSGDARDRGIAEQDTDQYDKDDEVFAPSAGAALYRRAMLDEIGLFDEDFFMYGEDVDLAFRGRLAGWKCRYVHTAKVIHYMGATSGIKSGFSIFYSNRNLVWIIIKDFPLRILVLSLPMIFFRNLADIPFYWYHGHGLTIIRSKVDCLMGLWKMWGKRKSIIHKIPNREIERWIHVRLKRQAYNFPDPDNG